MIVRIVRMTFAPEHTLAFQNIFENRKYLIENYEGCMGVKIMRDVNNSEVFFTISEWKTEAHLNTYRQSELFRNTWSEVKQWFTAPPIAYSLKDL